MKKTYGEWIKNDFLTPLISLHNLENQRQQILEIFDTITGESLNYGPADKVPRFSAICVNGIPFECSVSLSLRDSGGIRYVSEVAKPDDNIYNRLRISKNRTSNLLELIGAKNLSQTADDVFNIIFNEDIPIPATSRFGLWYGVVHKAGNAPTLKTYHNIEYLPRFVSWSRIKEVLEYFKLTSRLEEIYNLKRLFLHDTRPVAISVDYTLSNTGGVKIYFRGGSINYCLIQNILDCMSLTNYKYQFSLFHNIILDSIEEHTPCHCVISAGISPHNRSIPIKFEFSAVRLKNDILAQNKVCSLLKELGYDESVYRQTLIKMSNCPLSSQSVKVHTVIGVELMQGREIRVNVYMKPNFYIS